MKNSILVSETEKQFHYKNDDKRVSRVDHSKVLAMIFTLGRNASERGASIFDCPHQQGTPQAESWMDGFMFDQKRRGK